MAGTTFVSGGNALNTPLSLFLLELLLVVVLSRLIGAVLSKINEPLVIAEILAGILLGPTALGRIPGFKATLFAGTAISSLTIVSQWALVLFMFVVGLEQDTNVWRGSARRAFFASIVGIVVSMLTAVPFAFITNDPEFHSTNIGIYIVFIGLLTAVSALPVLARIMHEFNFLTTPLGVFTISVAAIEDLLAWPILAMITALATTLKTAPASSNSTLTPAAPGNSTATTGTLAAAEDHSTQSSGITILYIILLLVGYGILLFVVIRPLLSWIVRRWGMSRQFSPSVGSFMITMLVATSLIAEMIGVTALVGAFLFGCIVPREGPTCEGLLERLQYVITMAFVPLYFAASGLRTDFALLNSGRLWGLAVLFILFATAGKLIPSLVAGRYIAKFSWLDASMFGILLNTKGLVALVTLNIGLDVGIITEAMFAISIVMVLFNTFLTGPLIAVVYRLVKKESFNARNRDAAHGGSGGAEVSIIVAVGQAHPLVASEVARVAALLYGDEQDRAALHVWRVVDHLDADAAALGAPSPLSKIPFLKSTRREADSHVKAAHAAAREANMKVSIKSRISDANLPEELCRIARNGKAGSIVLAVDSIDALSGASLQKLVSDAPCDVVTVIPSLALALRAAASADSNGGGRKDNKLKRASRDADDPGDSSSSSSSSQSGDEATASTAGSSSSSSSKSGSSSKSIASATVKGARIIVAHVGGVHDDLAVDVAIGAASSRNPVLVIKCALPTGGDTHADGSSSESDTGNAAQQERFFELQGHFVQRTMAGMNIDVLFRSTPVDVAREVFNAMDAPIAPAALLVGFSSPLLEVFAERIASWRSPLVVFNSPLAPTEGHARGETVTTHHTLNKTASVHRPSSSLADIFPDVAAAAVDGDLSNLFMRTPESSEDASANDDQSALKLKVTTDTKKRRAKKRASEDDE